MKKIVITMLTAAGPFLLRAQNISIGNSPASFKLQLMGNADSTQLIIDAGVTQNNTHPLIRFRKSNALDIFWLNADNSSNFFAGLNAGRMNDINSGNFNTFFGSGSALSNTAGFFNNATGYRALSTNSSGNYNTAGGYFALRKNTAVENTAFGASALEANTSGTYNTSVGYAALAANSTGFSNTSIGRVSFPLTTGNYNTLTGGDALFHNTASSNTAAGWQTLMENTTGNYNAGFGAYSLNKNTTGFSNSAMGYSAAFDNTTGTNNTSIGAFSLTGDVFTASNNTAFGHGASVGNAYFIGNNNTVIGQDAAASAPNITNATAFGQSANSTASNQARLGNTVTNSIGGFTSWSNISDGRVKTDLLNNVPGILFINRLRPLTYSISLDAVSNIIPNKKRSDAEDSLTTATVFEEEAKIQKEETVYTGFIAQEVAKAAKDIGFQFSGVDSSKNSNDLYGLRYEEFVVPLTQAVQELAASLNAVEAEDKRQMEEIGRLRNKLRKQQAANVFSKKTTQ